jgi:hypothetical protein
MDGQEDSGSGMEIIQNIDQGLGMLEQVIASAPNGGSQFAQRMAKIRAEFQALIEEAMQGAQGGSQGGGSQPIMDQSQGQPMGMQGGMR